MHCWSTEYHLLTGLNMLDKLEYRFLPFNVWSFLYLHHYIQIIFCSHVVRKMLLFLFPEATTLKLLNVHKDMVHTCSSLFTRTAVLLLRKLLLEVTLPIITFTTYIYMISCMCNWTTNSSISSYICMSMFNKMMSLLIRLLLYIYKLIVSTCNCSCTAAHLKFACLQI